jgi:hypothetical protein
MHEVQTNKYPGVDGRPKFRRIDIHSLKISGKKVTTFTSQELYQEMSKLGVENINICMGHSQLSEILGAWQQLQEEIAEAAKQ